MPPSSDQDNTPPATSDSKPAKVTHKGTAGQVTSKNNKKNGQAKDSGGGGVMAAVRKDSKMNAKQTPQSTPNKSPEVKPVGSPPNVNPVTSPLLDALSSASFARSPSQNTSDWTKNVPVGTGYSTSPNNLINLGESPPTVPSSYEDRLSNFGWTTREQRGIPNGHFQSTSPPAPNRRRPLSYNHVEGSFQGFEDHRSQGTPYANRRSSMYSQQSRYGLNPPLPHQAQPHFYGAPDPSLLLSPTMPGLIPGDRGFYCGFDILPPREHSKSTENVVVTGYEGGFYIHAVTKRGLTKLFTIDGLRGGVYHAKILPWTIQGAFAHQFPLIAVVVHGPVWASNVSSGEDIAPLEHTSLTPTESLRGSPLPSGRQFQDVETVEYYQTSVEVYSISQNRHVGTLLTVPKVHIPIPMNSPLFRPPPPIGSLTTRADGGNLVITSGSTGETWIFQQSTAVSAGMFTCIGKVWTTVQHGVTVEGTSSGAVDSDWNQSSVEVGQKQFKASILSLNGRWLAYCPPAASSQVSLRATVPYNYTPVRVPGLNAHAPPQLPSVNCLVETPGGDSMVKQLVVLGTQKFIEGATYLGGQGVQAWNNYWYKPNQSQIFSGSPGYQPQQTNGQHFPPTHGTSIATPAVVKDPGLISILDLGAPAQQSGHNVPPNHPLATFKVPHGCSFLSFAPSGLALLSASSKGDVQFVWDLMRIQYAKSSFLKSGFQGATTQGPHVRQIAQFSRMTIARIVDVVWTSPHGERAAMVTEPGTVHVLDLPASAFTWPPPRRRPSLPKTEDGNEAIGAVVTATGVASSAVSSLWTAARPLVSRRRRSSTGLSAQTVTAQAGQGTQALAAGISRSVGAATGRMNELRKSGHAKLHLPRSATIPNISCTVLINGKKNDSVIVVAGGIVRFYTIKNRRADRPADKQKASKGAKYVEFRLPSLPDLRFPPRGIKASDFEITEGDLEARFRSKTTPNVIGRRHGTESSIPQAEIESNAPYQPFHTDRRVGLHIYSHIETSLASPSVSALFSPNQFAQQPESTTTITKSNVPWAFGGPIHTSKLDVGPPQQLDDELSNSIDHRALPSSAIERVMRVADNNEDIVVTTRRRKGASRNAENSTDTFEEGFFEDDCEVLDFASQRV